VVGLARSLHVLGRVTPREAFVRRARRELVARLPDRPEPRATWWEALWHRRLPLLHVRAGALVSALLVLAVIFVLTNGVLTAAAAAAPGDRLYGVQVQIDRLPLVFTRNTEAAARLRLELAAKRLSEAEQTVAVGHPDRVPAALRAYEAEMGALAEMVQRSHRQATAERAALMALWQGARAEHLAALARLQQAVGPEAVAPIRRAVVLWDGAEAAPDTGPSHETDRDPESAPPVDAPVGAPADMPADMPADVPADMPADVPADAPVAPPIDTPVGPRGPRNEPPSVERTPPAEQGPSPDRPDAAPSPPAPEDAERPDDAGRPEDAGKPEETGRLEGVGDPPARSDPPAPPQPGAPPGDARGPAQGPPQELPPESGDQGPSDPIPGPGQGG
jgi:hypothetical protein